MTTTHNMRLYPNLFSPLKIGQVTLPNRLVVPAMTTNFAEADGTIGPRLVDYLEARAAGGFGLIVTENFGVHASGRVMPRMGMVDGDESLPGLERMARAIHRHGAVLFGQISHAGRQTRSRITGHPLLAPSAIPCPLNREMPRELGLAQIEMLVEAYAAAAHRLQIAGFDGVEIHGAHGYLVAAFLSRYANQRSDAYGGSLENRMRFLLEIVAGIRDRCGPAFPISVRLSVEEFVVDGLVAEEASQIARALEQAGVHTISASVGTYESFNRLSMITGEVEGRWLPLARRITEAVAIPVMGVGRLKRPEVAEEALARGDMHLAAFGRASIADPDLPRKAAEGRAEETIWCLGCNMCLGRSARPQTICPVNPAVGEEARWHFAPVAEPRKVRVEGASLAGMTAAWVAARSGHRVEVVARETEIGGMQSWRARIPGMEEFSETIAALQMRAVREGVRFKLIADADADVVWKETRSPEVITQDILRIRPDAVPPSAILSQIELPSDGLAWAVFGSDIAATEAAIRLVASGRRVRLVSAMRDVCHDAHPGYREVSRLTLAALGVVTELSVEDWRARLAEIPPETRVVAGAVEPSESVDPETHCPGISDAYEAGAMTRCIYAAAEFARAEGGVSSGFADK